MAPTANMYGPSADLREPAAPSALIHPGLQARWRRPSLLAAMSVCAIIVGSSHGAAAPSSASSPSGSPSGSIVRVRHHYQDWYFVTLDRGYAESVDPASLDELAEEIASQAGVRQLSRVFLDEPRGFRVAGDESGARNLLNDRRVAALAEVGDLIREPNPIPGSYIVYLDPSLLGAGRHEVKELPADEAVEKVAEAIAAEYGGRIRYLYGALRGFAVEGLSSDAAVALSKDSRVVFVYQGATVHLDLEPADSRMPARQTPDDQPEVKR